MARSGVVQHVLRVGDEQGGHPAEATRPRPRADPVDRPGERRSPPYPRRHSPMRKLDIVQWGSDRLRVGTWRGDAAVAQIVPAPGQLPSRRDDRSLSRRVGHPGLPLRADERAHLRRTAAVPRRRLRGARTAAPAAPRPPQPCRRSRRVDPDRRFAAAGAATGPARCESTAPRSRRSGASTSAASRTPAPRRPSARFRVVDDGEVVGYAITGRAGSIGYLQRLAVLPDHQRRGIGHALVMDGLLWARRRGSHLGAGQHAGDERSRGSPLRAHGLHSARPTAWPCSNDRSAALEETA